jgi:arylsulfatase A-like enzyme
MERRKQLLPFFWETLAKKGQLYGNRLKGNKSYCTNSFWFSYPGYSEILTGFSDPRIRSNDKIPNPNQTILEFFNNKKEFKGKVAAFGSWDVFPFIVNEERSGIPVNAGFRKAKGKKLSAKEKFLNELQDQVPSPWGSVRLDAFTHHYALEYIKKNKPKLVYIAYGETDDFAHDGEYDAYLKSAHQTDAFIKELWDYVQSNRKYKNKTTFIITTDHGRGYETKADWKSHGKTYLGSNEIWIAAIGPDTPALGEVTTGEQTLQSQLAKTIAKLLGYDYDNKEFEVGTVIPTIFK